MDAVDAVDAMNGTTSSTPPAHRCGSGRRRLGSRVSALAAAALLVALVPRSGLAEEATDEDPFYADRFVVPDDSEFLEAQPKGEEGADEESEGHSRLQRKDVSPYEPYFHAGAMVFDGAVVRVPAVGSLLVGSALFALSAPAAAAGGVLDDAAEVFVRSPYRFAFVRPLGEFAD